MAIQSQVAQPSQAQAPTAQSQQTQSQTPTTTSTPTAPTKRSILLYGDSGDGKTALVGEMAEWVYKKEGKITRLATSDRGGLETIRPYVDLGIVEVEALGESDPWIWLNKVVRGYRKAAGKWSVDAAANAKVGLWAFEGFTSIGDALMQNLAQKAAAGTNIGGGGNVNFNVSADGESLKVGGNNMAHYGVVQTRIVEETWESQRLPGWLLWTAAAKRDDDPNAAGKVLGPAIVGKALTAEVPRWFIYTFRVAAVPGMAGAPEKHILYLGDHQDMHSGGAKGLGNTRVPLDSPKMPTSLEPASLVKAIEVIQASYDPAVAAIKARLGMR